MDKKIVFCSSRNSSDEILLKVALPLEGAKWDQKPSGLQSFDSYSWIENVKEDHESQRCKYLAYLSENVKRPDKFELFDAQPDRTLLSVNLFSLKVSGTTDVVMLEKRHSQVKAIKK